MIKKSRLRRAKTTPHIVMESRSLGLRINSRRAKAARPVARPEMAKREKLTMRGKRSADRQPCTKPSAEPRAMMVGGLWSRSHTTKLLRVSRMPCSVMYLVRSEETTILRVSSEGGAVGPAAAISFSVMFISALICLASQGGGRGVSIFI